MHVDLGTLYNDTITVINKLDARDATLKEDAYFKHTLNGCMWSETSQRAVSSDGTVDIGTVFRVQIPENPFYLPYKEWCKQGNRSDHFTVSHGDYIVLGEVEEEITAANLNKVMRLYEPNAFQVQHFRDLTHGEGMEHSTAGVMRFAEVLYIEG